MLQRVSHFARGFTTAPRYPHLPPALPMPAAEQLRRFCTGVSTFMLDGARQMGGAFTIDMLGAEPMVCLTDVESAKRVAAGRPEDFRNSNDIVTFFLGSRSILLLDGDPHKHARRRTMSAFSGKRILDYGDIMLDAANRYLDGIREGDRISGSDLGVEMALEIILRALFGMDLDERYARIWALTREFIGGGHSPLATAASLTMSDGRMRRFVIGARDPETMRRLPASGVEAWLERVPTFASARTLVDELVALAEHRRATLSDADQDGFAHILRTAEAEGHDYGAEDALEELVTLLLAGHDTTAVSLCRLLVRLADAPDVVAKLRAELDETFGDGPIVPQKLERLPYLNAVIEEGMRIDAIGRGAGRRLARDMNLGGYDLPAGTQVVAYVYHHSIDPENFAAAERFDPDQMLGRRLKAHESAPFGMGYRRCIGAAFALFEMKVLTAQIVRRATFAVPEGLEAEEGMLGPIIALMGPVPLDVTSLRPARA